MLWDDSRLALSRRRLVQLGGGALALTAVSRVLGPEGAWAVDTYDTMRGVWVDLLTGSGFDPNSEPYASALSTLGTNASGYQSSMAPTTGSLWPDLPIGTKSANVTTSYSRLRTMALAYVQPNTGLTGSASLASSIATGLDWMYGNAYTPTTTTYDNWWDWQIGAPQALLDAVALMYAQLTTTQVANYCAAVDHFVNASTVASYSGTSTGANRVDQCRVLALRGVVGKSAGQLDTAKSALSPVFPYVLTGDGMYADGSFIQHTYVPYTGTYGVILLNGLGKLITLLSGTTWAITDPNVQDVYSSVSTAYAPVVYNGLCFDAQSGRAIARSAESEHTRGHGLLGSILLLAKSGGPSPAESDSWKAMVKGWLQRDTTSPYLDDKTVAIPELARAQALLGDSSVSATAEPVSSRVYAMDRAVHRRAGWAAAVSMCSARTTFYENGNGENLKGWHTNSGFVQWYGATYGNDQYSDSFWPTVDPYQLPGTTVSTKALADGAGGAWGAAHPGNTFAGGATDGTFSVVGQDVRGLSSTLVGKKSWFCLDDSLVCLGAGITATDGTTVQTTVDNRNLGTGTGPALTVDGTVQSSTLGWSQTFTGCQYMAIDGMGAYVFPGGATVNAKRVARTGSWSSINTAGSTTSITRNYLSIWFDHGTSPSSASYAYQLMPGATAADAAARAASPNVTILVNSATAQAIEVPSLGLTMANFHAAGSAGPITVDGPCSVLMKEQSGSLSVAVSDPTRTLTTVKVTIARTGYASVSSTSGTTVLTTSGQVVVLAEVGGTQGASRTATVATTGTAPTPRTAGQLSATATTYVRDGSYAATNYGNQTTMVVKNDNRTNTGYNRRSLVKFDVSGVSGTVSRAVLWVYGNTSDSGGTTTTLQAFDTGSSTWTETGVTWNTAPTLTTALGTGRISTKGDWIGLDVTSAVAAASPAGGGSGTASLGIWEPLNAVGLATVLNTRTNAANQPRLEVVSG